MLGIPFSLMGLLERHDEFYDTKMGPNVSTARHALAIDEQREDFESTVWLPRPGVDLKQVWFAGVYTDVGGFHPPDRETGIQASDTPFQWMLDEARNAGLKIEAHLQTSLTDGSLGKLHKSRRHVYRFKKPLNRPIVIRDKPTTIHLRLPGPSFWKKHCPGFIATQNQFTPHCPGSRFSAVRFWSALFSTATTA